MRRFPTPLFLTGDEPETVAARERRSAEATMLSDPDIRKIFNAWADPLINEPLSRQIIYGIPAVRAAVDKISDTIAALPLYYYTQADGSARSLATKDPIYGLLLGKINAHFETSNRWKKIATTDLLLDGRHLSRIERNKAGRIKNIWPLKLANFEREIRTEFGKTYVFRKDDGSLVEYPAENIIDLILIPSLDDPGYIRPIALHHDLFALCRATERFAAKIFKNGGLPPAVINGPPPSSPQAAARAKSEINEEIRLSGEGGEAPILPNGYVYTPVGFNLADLQLLELKQAQLREIAQIYGVPPIYLQDYTSGTFNNSEQQQLFFFKNAIVPICELIEAELNVKLAPSNTNFVEFEIEHALRGDALARANAQRTQIYAGIKSINEVRDEYNLAPVPGGDVVRIQQATVPLDYVEKLLELKLSVGDLPNSTQDGQEPVDPPAE